MCAAAGPEDCRSFVPRRVVVRALLCFVADMHQSMCEQTYTRCAPRRRRLVLRSGSFIGGSSCGFFLRFLCQV